MKRVIITEHGGAVKEKILVEEVEDILVVTTEEEWINSQRERRPPVTVGFRREYLYQEKGQIKP